jgi:hypothetical protein
MKKKKERRKKLRSLILLLFLTIIMFGTATYAWFTANRMVTISTLNVHVEASNGLQISTDASSWKSVITNADITTYAYSGHTNMVPANVTNVSTNGSVNATNGRMNMYKSVIGNDATTGDYNITTTADTETAGSTGNFIAFDIFLRVDSQQDIYLTSDSNVEVKQNTTDKGLKNAARVAFVKQGHGDSTAAVGTLTGLNNQIASSAIIWEPNCDTHMPIVTSQVAPEYGVVIGNQQPDTEHPDVVPDNYTNYYGVNKAISSPVDLKDLVNGTDTTNADAVIPDIRTVSGKTAYNQIFTLAAGVTKFRVYMWIEGQDIDCENNATGSDIVFNVQLSTESSAPSGG